MNSLPGFLDGLTPIYKNPQSGMATLRKKKEDLRVVLIERKLLENIHSVFIGLIKELRLQLASRSVQ